MLLRRFKAHRHKNTLDQIKKLAFGYINLKILVKTEKSCMNSSQKTITK